MKWSARKAKKKILVVDDEESFGKSVKLTLEGTGDYEVEVESKGTQALTTAQVFKPDLIFLDVLMPDMDGAEISRQLKDDKDLAGIPVVFMTAIVQETEVTSRGGNIGGRPFVAKPVTTEKLIDCIKKYIRK